MKTFKYAAVASAAFLALGSAASAATFVFAPGVGGLTAGQTNYADFQTTFGTQVGVSSAGVYAGSVGGVAAEPASGDQGDPFFAVLGGGTATFDFGAGATQFGFDFGSADTYNNLLLTFVDGSTQSFTGQVLNSVFDANGNQVGTGTNGRVTVFGNGLAIKSVTFSSTANSFEFDNIGVAGVPEPATWAMLILGFGIIGGAMRRKARTAGSVSFA